MGQTCYVLEIQIDCSCGRKWLRTGYNLRGCRQLRGSPAPSPSPQAYFLQKLHGQHRQRRAESRTAGLAAKMLISGTASGPRLAQLRLTVC